MKFKQAILRKAVKILVSKKSTWLNSIIKEAVFEQSFIPEIIRNRKYFFLWESRGYHISENHFYHPIPELSSLREGYWKHVDSLEGIKLNIEQQLQFLGEIKREYAVKYNAFPLHKDEITLPWEYYLKNKNFESVDGEVLYSMVRKNKPKRIIEIGAGFTTFLISKAIEDEKNENKNYEVKFDSIEPFPRGILNTEIPGLNSFINQAVQDGPVSLFKELEENDILFIDSTHMLKYGSDVEYEFFKILPILKEGVLIHFHDIFLPSPYPRKWSHENGWFWNEQYLLQSFLMFNDSFEIMFGAGLMHNFHPEKLSEAFKSYNPEKVNPGSFWIRKIS